MSRSRWQIGVLLRLGPSRSAHVFVKGYERSAHAPETVEVDDDGPGDAIRRVFGPVRNAVDRLRDGMGPLAVEVEGLSGLSGAVHRYLCDPAT